MLTFLSRIFGSLWAKIALGVGILIIVWAAWSYVGGLNATIENLGLQVTALKAEIEIKDFIISSYEAVIKSKTEDSRVAREAVNDVNDKLASADRDRLTLNQRLERLTTGFNNLRSLVNSRDGVPPETGTISEFARGVAADTNAFAKEDARCNLIVTGSTLTPADDTNSICPESVRLRKTR